MQTTIKLSDGRKVSIDISRLTYLKIKELRKGLRKTSKEEVSDPEIVKKQIAELSAAPITEKSLMKAYYALAANTKEVDDSEALEEFADKMKVVSCQWYKDGGGIKEMTYEEYLSLPWTDVSLIEKEYNKQNKAVEFLEGATDKDKGDFLAK